MDMTDFRAEIDKKISELESQIDVLKKLRDGLDNEVVRPLIQKLAGLNEGNTLLSKAGTDIPTIHGQPTVFARIISFFNKRNNSPASVKEIANATGAPVSRIRSMFYVSRNKDVEKIQAGDVILWRIRSGLMKQSANERDSGPASIEMNPR